MHAPGSGRFGSHDVAIIADDLEAAGQELQREGAPVVWRAHLPQMDLTWAMADTTARLGHFVEVYQNGPAIAELYRTIEAADQGFEGHDLLRDMTL